jgi:hypothetical protein
MAQGIQQDQPAPQRRSPVNLVQGQEVSLGCGTLILIALIVAFCSGGGRTDLSPVQQRLNDIDQRLPSVQQKLDAMDQRLQRIEQELKQLTQKAKP